MTRSGAYEGWLAFQVQSRLKSLSIHSALQSLNTTSFDSLLKQLTSIRRTNAYSCSQEARPRAGRVGPQNHPHSLLTNQHGSVRVTTLRGVSALIVPMRGGVTNSAAHQSTWCVRSLYLRYVDSVGLFHAGRRHSAACCKRCWPSRGGEVPCPRM